MIDVELRLLAGKPVLFEQGFLRSPKISDVIEIGEQKYNQYLAHLLIDKGELDNKDISNFDVAFYNCYYNEGFRNTFFNALKFMFNEIPILYGNEEDLCFMFGDEIEHWRLDKNNFSQFQEIVKLANNISIQKEDYNPGNDKAAKFIDRIKAIKASRPKPKEKMNLFSIIRGLAWRDNDINILNIFDLTVYQLYQGFFTIEKIDNYRSVVQGIYSGTVDGKKIKYSDMHWANLDK